MEAARRASQDGGLTYNGSKVSFLQRFLLHGDEETQGIRCGETAAARARDAVCYAVPGYSTGDTRRLQKEVFHPGGGARFH